MKKSLGLVHMLFKWTLKTFVSGGLTYCHTTSQEYLLPLYYRYPFFWGVGGRLHHLPPTKIASLFCHKIISYMTVYHITLIITQLLSRLNSLFYVNKEPCYVNNAFTKLYWISSIHSKFHAIFLKRRLFISLSFTTRNRKWSFLEGFPAEIMYSCLISAICYTSPARQILCN